tara:strand:- start:3794 stop:3985 length:192 start_codon:yes stop_codon:yes gene_type:complete
MALVGIQANGQIKTLIIGLTIAVAVLTIVVHMKNIKKMDEVEEANSTRLAVLEEKVSTLEGQQ